MSVLVIGLEFLVVAWVAKLWVFGAFLVVVGSALSGSNVGITTIVKRETLDSWRGRLFSLVATTWELLMVVGTVVGSALDGATSVRTVFVMVGKVYAVRGFWPWERRCG